MCGVKQKLLEQSQSACGLEMIRALPLPPLPPLLPLLLLLLLQLLAPAHSQIPLITKPVDIGQSTELIFLTDTFLFAHLS